MLDCIVLRGVSNHLSLNVSSGHYLALLLGLKFPEL